MTSNTLPLSIVLSRCESKTCTVHENPLRLAVLNGMVYVLALKNLIIATTIFMNTDAL